MEQYIDIVFDGPPSHESGRFVEVENEDRQSINVGTWIAPTPTNDPQGTGFWRLRLKVRPGLDALAAKINETSTNHGFWPENHEEKQALSFLADAANGNGLIDRAEVSAAIDKITPKLAESRNFGEMLMLATSELAEALEEHRSGKPVVYFKLTLSPTAKMTKESAAIINRLRDEVEVRALNPDTDWNPDVTQADWDQLVRDGLAKPEGAAVELMDNIIRSLDTMYALLKNEPYSIEDIAALKMRYNATRPYKHGRAY
jgi:hypothetical protein